MPPAVADAPKPVISSTPLRVAITFTTYFAAVCLGLAIPIADGIVTPVWAPSGIALAALTLWGTRLWPVVLLAALAGNWTDGAPALLAVGSAIGSTIAAVGGAHVLRRRRLRPVLDRTGDVALLVAVGLGSSLVSATIGVSLLVTMTEMPMPFVERWVLWWLGDTLGTIIVGSFIFAFKARLRERKRPSRRSVVEFSILIAALVALSILVFSGATWRQPLLLFPLWIWAALRFRAIGTTLLTLVACSISIGFTAGGTSAAPGASIEETVQLLQAVIAVIGVSMMLISATLAERDATHRALELALVDEQLVARQLREVDELKDRLLAAVSHELRTPLTSILALSAMLRDRHDTIDAAKRVEMHEHLSREARRLDGLLRDLLDLERLRLGLLEPRMEPVDINVVVRDVLERFLDGERPIRLDLQPVRVDADLVKVERIVDNLVGNAFKHTPAESCVGVSVRKVDGGALIVVDDEGSGVPDEDKKAIFEAFYRGSGSALESVPGTGIGLSLAAHFTNLHGGRAWVEDRVGGGASFRVFLPQRA